MLTELVLGNFKLVEFWTVRIIPGGKFADGSAIHFDNTALDKKGSRAGWLGESTVGVDLGEEHIAIEIGHSWNICSAATFGVQGQLENISLKFFEED